MTGGKADWGCTNIREQLLKAESEARTHGLHVVLNAVRQTGIILPEVDWVSTSREGKGIVRTAATIGILHYAECQERSLSICSTCIFVVSC